MLVDLFIILGSLNVLYRGRCSGFVRQFLAFGGFFGGLFLGSWLQPHTVSLSQTAQSRAVILAGTILGSALIGLTLGEYLGLHLKRRLFQLRINKIDNILGSGMSLVSLLLSIWLLASIASGLPFNTLHVALRSSRIIVGLNRLLPPAPTVISKLGRLIDPNGFPDVFIGNEPIPRSPVNLPALGDLEPAVNSDKNSVLRIKGQGCGGVVSGSGFVIGKDLVATNAHVVAGITHPYAQDANGSHSANVIWFDPGLDFAILHVNHLAGQSLSISPDIADRGTPAAVLGYPGGGNFSAEPAAVLDYFQASGRDIYGRGHTLREVSEIQADIIPGNSGGPLIDREGKVIGIVFAESTSYNHVGYSLNTGQIISELKQATNQTSHPVGTGHCTE